MSAARFTFAMFGLMLAVVSESARAAEYAPETEAQSRAVEWLKKQGDKIVIDYKANDKEPGFVGSKIIGSNDTMYVLSSNGWFVNLGFAGKVQKEDTAESLNKRLKYIALDKVPTSGLEVKGWDIKPMTPVSSFKEGVEIREFKDGLVKVAVKTKCFALSGSVKKDLLGPQPADAPAPQGTYFQHRQNFPLEITFEAPLRLPQ